MGGKLEAGLSPDSPDEVGEAADVSSLYSNMGKFFEEECPRYMAMGMSLDEYWNGDASLVKYYVKAAMLRKELANEMAWIQGRYIYDTITSLWSLLNGFAKPKPEPYVKEPYPLTMKDARQRKKAADEKKRKEEQAKLIANLTAVYKAGQKKNQLKGDGQQNA